MYALVFPGQGSQSLGMGRTLAAQFRSAKDVFAEVDEALRQKLSTLMWEGTAEDLALTTNTQPALMAVSMAVVRVLQAEAGLDVAKAAFVAGHSLGEYSALTAAGSLSLSDTARLLRIRGDAMQKAVPVGVGAMAAILGLDFEAVAELAKEAAAADICEAANDNGGGQVVVSGHVAAVERAMKLASERGAKRAILLPVSAPFHCALMQPAADAMQEALSEVKIIAPKAPLVANIHAASTTNIDQIRHGLVAQVVGTVRWRESVQYMAQKSVETFYELGAGKVLGGLIKRISAEAHNKNISTPEDVALYTDQGIS
jgi:[acyl-carrier-protein] S-malonyltransferase